jgi:hypothetical protein
MSRTALVYLNVQVTGGGLDPLNIVPTFVSNTDSPATHVIIALTNGNTILTPPTNAAYALLVPISGAAATKTLKGTTTDTGYALSTTQPTLLALTTTPGTFYVAADTSENLDAYFF